MELNFFNKKKKRKSATQKIKEHNERKEKQRQLEKVRDKVAEKAKGAFGTLMGTISGKKEHNALKLW